MGMKQIILKGTLVFSLGVVGVIGFAELNGKDVAGEGQGKGIGLQVEGKKDLKALVDETNFIVAVSVQDDYEVLEEKIPDEKEVYYVNHHYKIVVNKNFKDKEGNKYKKGDVLDLIVPVGLTQKKEGQSQGLLPLADDQVELESGSEYLLFMSTRFYEPLGKEVFQISNFNHIYKKDGNNYKNIGSELIPEIQEENL